jgi:hypothetical protein
LAAEALLHEQTAETSSACAAQDDDEDWSLVDAMTAATIRDELGLKVGFVVARKNFNNA